MNLIKQAMRRLALPITRGRHVAVHAPIPKIAGVRLSMESAFAVSAVFACITVIAKSLAGNRCHWEVVEMKSNGDWEYRRNTVAWWLLNYQPNYEQTPKVFKETMFTAALLWGDGVSEIERDMQGRPLWLWPLDPFRTCVERNANMEKVVLWDNNIEIPYKDVIHFQGPSFGDGLSGANMVAVAAVTIAQCLAADQFNLKFYEHGTAMGGIVSTDQDLDQAELDDLTETLKKRVEGAEQAFRLLILGSGLKFQPVNQTQKDGMVLDTRYFLIEEICRYFGMQPHMIAHLLRSTNNNIEQQGLEFTSYTLTPWVTGAEEECSIKLLPTRSSYLVRIDTDELAEGDAKSRADTDSALVNAGLRTRNELRQKRGWNSYGPVGDKVTVQAQLTTLDQLGGAAAQSPDGAAALMFRNAMRRVAMRQVHKARDAQSASDLMKTRDDDVAYAARQFSELAPVFVSLGIDGRISGAAIAKFVDENLEMISRSFPNIDWDIDSRCLLAAKEFAAMMSDRREA